MLSALGHFILHKTYRGIKNEEIKSSLISAGWPEKEVYKAFQEMHSELDKEVPMPLPKNREWDINLTSLTASQLLLYIGAVIVLMASIIFIGINWHDWGSLVRILVILAVFLFLEGTGVSLWYKNNYQKHSIILLFSASFIFPLLLTIIFSEYNVFAPAEYNKFAFVVTFVSFILYSIHSYVYVFPVWSLLTPLMGMVSYWFFWQVIDIKGATNISLLFIPIAVALFIQAVRNELKQRFQDSRYLYGLSSFLIILCIETLVFDGAFVKGYFFSSYTTSGVSHILSGITFLILGYLSQISTKFNIKEYAKHHDWFNLLGSFSVLGGLFYMGLGGHKPVIEIFLLIVSLAFISASIVKISKEFLYIGTLFLIIFIFDIGEEYFSRTIGWSLTLFVAGISAMLIGLSMEKIKRKYFKNDAP